MLHSSKYYLQRQPGGGDEPQQALWKERRQLSPHQRMMPTQEEDTMRVGPWEEMWPELVPQITFAVGVSLPRASLWAGSQPSPVLLLTLRLFFFLKPVPVLGIKEKTGCVCTGFGLLRALFFSSQCHLSFMVLLYMDSSTAGPVFLGPYATWQK